MPTLAGDTQMLLADGKVLFQNQEVAFVVAESREAAADTPSRRRCDCFGCRHRLFDCGGIEMTCGAWKVPQSVSSPLILSNEATHWQVSSGHGCTRG